MPVGRSRFSNDPKDILCQGDTGDQLEASGQCTVSPQGSILVDKQMDPFSSQWKERKECDINIKSDYEATVRGESLSRKCIQKSKEGMTMVLDFGGVFGQECRGIIPPFIK